MPRARGPAARFLPVFALALLCACGSRPGSPSVPRSQAREAVQTSTDPKIQLLEHQVWGRDGEQWASVRLVDGSGAFVTGRVLGDFTVTETRRLPDGSTEGPMEIAFDQPGYQFEGPGFWERTVTGEKVDLAVVVSSSLGDQASQVRDELHALVDRLEASRLDFRLALIEAESCITIHCNGVFPFHGPMETEELRGAVDELYLEGSDFSPTALYDALLWSATDLLWREGADVTRLVVVVTNDMPQSVYGNVWHLDNHGTATNRAGARLALEEAGLTLYYAQPTGPEGFRYLEGYADAERNPRAACSRGEGGWDCGFEGLGERLSWPFDQEEIPLPEPGPVVDSRYYFAWLSPFGPVEDPDETRVVEIRTTDPDDPTRDITLTFEYGFPGEEGALRLVLTDEVGDPLPASLDECVSVYRAMGDRAVELDEVCPGDGGEDGVAPIYLLMPGPVVLEMGYDFATNPWYVNSYYSDLGYQGARFDVEVPAGETLDVPWQVEVKDRRADLWRIRGLLEDLRGWGLGSRPFAGVADRIGAWVEGFETGPMTLEDKERLIRLTHALGGYLYLSGYAETQTRKVESGLIDVIRRLRAIIQKLRDTADEADTVGWLTDAEAAARLAATVGLDVEAWVAIGEAEALRALARALLEYAEEELVPEVIEKILEQIHLGPAGPYIEQFLVGVVLDDWDSAGSLWDTVGELTLDGVLDAAVAAAPELLRAAGDEVLSGLPDEAADAYDLLFNLIEALARDGTDGLTEAIRSTAQDLLARYASPEAALARVRDAVSVLTETLSPGPVRDALVPVLDLMLRVALEEGDFDNDAAIGVLATLFVRYAILDPGFNTPVAGQLDDLLEAAKGFAPTPAGPGFDEYDREAAIDDALEYLRDAYWIDDAPPPGGDWQGFHAVGMDAWDTLAALEPLDDTANALSTVKEITEAAMYPITFSLCGRLYPTCSLMDDLENFTLALDAVGLFTRAVELGLRLDDLLEMPGEMAPAADAVFF